MRRILILLAALAMGATVALPGLATAQTTDPDEVVMKPLVAPHHRSGFSTAAASTVWYGFLASSTDPNKVGVGGKWDFDTPYYASDLTGTDSTQFWTFVQSPMTADGTTKYLTTVSRPFWYYDYGNDINHGDHNLTVDRLANGRVTRMVGLCGVWHQDNLTTVPDTGRVSPGFATNIAGSGSAWCGLRACGDLNAPTDPYTGNRYTADDERVDFIGFASPRSAWPGYASQWDQLLYRDFAYNAVSPGTISFDFRSELSNSPTGDPGTSPDDGGGWFTPDPFSSANMVHKTVANPFEPVDSFEVWVGAPKESGVYDSAHRYLSDAIDFGLSGASAPAILFARTGIVSGNSGALAIPAGASWATVRIVFRVKTNRFFDDARPSTTPNATAFNSTTGAVVIDNVNVNGNVSDFESASQILPRFTRTGNTFAENSPTASWITTGRSPAYYGHIHNVNDLPFADPCGKLFCNLNENIIVQSNHDPDGANPAHTFHKESYNWACSPTIILHDNAGRAAAQGSAPTIRSDATGTDLQFDYYSGFDDAALSGVFFWYSLRTEYDPALANSGEKQVEGPTIVQWGSMSIVAINDFGTPVCQTLDSSPGDLNGYINIAHADSVQVGLLNETRCARFSATACGQTDGSYWDNIRMGFITGAVSHPAVSTFFWFLLGDTFPFNESISPGSSAFDTTTALVKDGLNNGKTGGGEGVICGDSLVYVSPFSGNDSRMDLVFRIKPGPGNYSVKGTRSSPLWKVPSNPGLGTASGGDNSFWGQYMKQSDEKNGQVGSTPDGHTATRWDPQTWNSARMDSAQATNLYPVQFRSIGNVANDTWQSTYEESDPKGGARGNGGSPAPLALANPQPECFVVNVNGPVNRSNICCDPASCAAIGGATYPPAGYPGASTTTYEGVKILPDGIFTPGTHIQYFVRRSAASNPSVMQNMSPDTTTVAYQPGMGGSFDMLRYDHMDVLPDMWKDTRFGGNGLACVLYVDAGDRRGGEPAVVGALDSLAFGVDNGAERGWKAVAGSSDVNNPAGFVPVNLGAMGLLYDKFDIRASESGEGDRLGCRIVGGGVDAGVSDRQCKQGPTVAMLDHYYSMILWDSVDLDESAGAMHDGSGIGQEQSDDAGIINQWLDAASSGDEKALWGSGDGLAQDLANSNGTSCGILLSRMGGLFVQDNYFDYTGNQRTTAIFKPLDADPGAPDPFHSSRRYGIFNSCQSKLDVIDRDGGVSDAERAARYEDVSDRGSGSAGPFYSSVYRRLDAGAGRFYATLLDGFSFDNLRGWGGPMDPGSSNESALSANDAGRFAWMTDALTAFSLCRVPIDISVGDVPGLALNFVRGVYPNPAPGSATVRFSLAQPAKVTIRFYNVAGRLVHEAVVDGHVGDDNVYRWDGVTSEGTKAASGVYFYRLSAPGVRFENNSQRMVLLGQADR